MMTRQDFARFLTIGSATRRGQADNSTNMPVESGNVCLLPFVP